MFDGRTKDAAAAKTETNAAGAMLVASHRRYRSLRETAELRVSSEEPRRLVMRGLESRPGF